VIDFNRDFAELAEKEKSGVWGRALASLNNCKAIYFGVEWPRPRGHHAMMETAIF
jgi:hypothetical protein